jgi:hypothetical protein
MIIVRIWEGLGNQLFQYAYARALQLRTRNKVYLDCDRCFAIELEGQRCHRDYALENFNIKLHHYYKSDKIYFFLENRTYVQKIMYWISQRKHTMFHYYKEQDVKYKEELKYLRGNYYVMGWMQNEKYFKEYRTELLKEIRLKKKIIVSQKLKVIMNSENTVSVHVRRKDFKKFNNTLPITYYEKAVNLIENKVENPFFIIFTDDLEWTKSNSFLKQNRVYYIAEEKLHDYEELMVMSRCKHNIIANSTFSWWGAWLNTYEGKIVIGPRIWFRDKIHSKLNIMPDEWIHI